MVNIKIGDLYGIYRNRAWNPMKMRNTSYCHNTTVGIFWRHHIAFFNAKPCPNFMSILFLFPVLLQVLNVRELMRNPAIWKFFVLIVINICSLGWVDQPYIDLSMPNKCPLKSESIKIWSTPVFETVGKNQSGSFRVKLGVQ